MTFKILSDCINFCHISVDHVAIKIISIFNGIVLYFWQGGFSLGDFSNLVNFLPITVGTAVLSYLVFTIIDKAINLYSNNVSKIVKNTRESTRESYEKYIIKLEKDNTRLLNSIDTLEAKIDRLTQELIQNNDD